MQKTTEEPIQAWAKKIDFRKRAKAVCKPCWELKYCPYGPLVEDFPLRTRPDERSCRIFGHDCPVFYVAEPLTETKDLRNISRRIPRTVQFRVLKRENQICRECGKSVKDEDVHFDHIIPWTKGGPSEEHNIQLLCSKCNLEKGKSFEQKYLVDSFRDHISEPVGFEILEFLSDILRCAHQLRQANARLPTAQEIAQHFGVRKVSIVEERASEIIRDLDVFFQGRRPEEIGQKIFQALRHRWAFQDGVMMKLRNAAKVFNVELDDLYAAEISLINRLGWRVDQSATLRSRWLRH